jgi:hypothetical protein
MLTLQTRTFYYLFINISARLDDDINDFLTSTKKIKDLLPKSLLNELNEIEELAKKPIATTEFLASDFSIKSQRKKQIEQKLGDLKKRLTKCIAHLDQKQNQQKTKQNQQKLKETLEKCGAILHTVNTCLTILNSKGVCFGHSMITAINRPYYSQALSIIGELGRIEDRNERVSCDYFGGGKFTVGEIVDRFYVDLFLHQENDDFVKTFDLNLQKSLENLDGHLTLWRVPDPRQKMEVTVPLMFETYTIDSTKDKNADELLVSSSDTIKFIQDSANKKIYINVKDKNNKNKPIQIEISDELKTLLLDNLFPNPPEIAKILANQEPIKRKIFKQLRERFSRENIKLDEYAIRTITSKNMEVRKEKELTDKLCATQLKTDLENNRDLLADGSLFFIIKLTPPDIHLWEVFKRHLPSSHAVTVKVRKELDSASNGKVRYSYVYFDSNRNVNIFEQNVDTFVNRIIADIQRYKTNVFSSLFYRIFPLREGVKAKISRQPSLSKPFNQPKDLKPKVPHSDEIETSITNFLKILDDSAQSTETSDDADKNLLTRFDQFAPKIQDEIIKRTNISKLFPKNYMYFFKLLAKNNSQGCQRIAATFPSVARDFWKIENPYYDYKFNAFIEMFCQLINDNQQKTEIASKSFSGGVCNSTCLWNQVYAVCTHDNMYKQYPHTRKMVEMLLDHENPLAIIARECAYPEKLLHFYEYAKKIDLSKAQSTIVIQLSKNCAVERNASTLNAIVDYNHSSKIKGKDKKLLFNYDVPPTSTEAKDIELSNAFKQLQGIALNSLAIKDRYNHPFLYNIVNMQDEELIEIISTNLKKTPADYFFTKELTDAVLILNAEGKLETLELIKNKSPELYKQILPVLEKKIGDKSWLLEKAPQPQTLIAVCQLINEKQKEDKGIAHNLSLPSIEKLTEIVIHHITKKALLYNTQQTRQLYEVLHQLLLQLPKINQNLQNTEIELIDTSDNAPKAPLKFKGHLLKKELIDLENQLKNLFAWMQQDQYTTDVQSQLLAYTKENIKLFPSSSIVFDSKVITKSDFFDDSPNTPKISRF